MAKATGVLWQRVCFCLQSFLAFQQEWSLLPKNRDLNLVDVSKQWALGLLYGEGHLCSDRQKWSEEKRVLLFVFIIYFLVYGPQPHTHTQESSPGPVTTALLPKGSSHYRSYKGAKKQLNTPIILLDQERNSVI